MFKLDKSDLYGIEKWSQWYQEWSRNPIRKYTAKEDDAKRKKCKVGKYRNWTFSEKRFNEISNFYFNQKIHKTRETNIRQFFAKKGEDLGDITYPEMLKRGLHREAFSEKRAKIIEEDSKDLF